MQLLQFNHVCIHTLRIVSLSIRPQVLQYLFMLSLHSLLNNVDLCVIDGFIITNAYATNYQMYYQYNHNYNAI